MSLDVYHPAPLGHAHEILGQLRRGQCKGDVGYRTAVLLGARGEQLRLIQHGIQQRGFLFITALHLRDAALRLDHHIHIVKDIRDLYKRSDYVTFHIHCTDQTRGMVDADAIASMKRGIRVINLARGEIVQDDAMIPALETGRVAAYITDFPNNRLLAAPHVVAMPHLGASTPESEQNCAVMAADELKDYLETGNVRNSVNLPAVSMTPSGVMRLCILHKNVPGMLANITTLFGRDGVNVENLSNKSKGDWAYTMVDLAAHIGDDVLQDVRAMEHVVRVRAINW